MRFLLALFLLLPFALIAQARADDVTEATLIIKDHRFEPSELSVPAGKRLRLTVKNQDASPEEFESNDLGIEKVISGNSEAVVNVRPLKAGTYEFAGEFHESTAKGTITAK